MSKFSKEFLGRTVRAWEQYTHESLSLKDAQEIAENMTGLFSLLSEWKEKDGEKEKHYESNLTKRTK